MAWKNGPLPADTWGWGGVVKNGESPAMGFYFASFEGDHAVIFPDKEKVPADKVAKYDNSLELPPE